jgi:hypothetical protein
VNERKAVIEGDTRMQTGMETAERNDIFNAED